MPGAGGTEEAPQVRKGCGREGHGDVWESEGLPAVRVIGIGVRTSTGMIVFYHV